MILVLQFFGNLELVSNLAKFEEIQKKIEICNNLQQNFCKLLKICKMVSNIDKCAISWRNRKNPGSQQLVPDFLQIFRDSEIVSKVTKYANSWRNKY